LFATIVLIATGALVFFAAGFCVGWALRWQHELDRHQDGIWWQDAVILRP
jgi:hypothetical protein